MLSVQTKPNQGGDNLASPSISSTVIASVTISIISLICVSGRRTGGRRTLGGSGLSLKQTSGASEERRGEQYNKLLSFQRGSAKTSGAATCTGGGAGGGIFVNTNGLYGTR